MADGLADSDWLAGGSIGSTVAGLPQATAKKAKASVAAVMTGNLFPSTVTRCLVNVVNIMTHWPKYLSVCAVTAGVETGTALKSLSL